MRKILLSLSLLFIAHSLLAKEGMWIPYLIGQLNHQEMKEMGLEISAEDIYSVNSSSLKDAIVHFGGGCTAEIISNKSLLLTNHHCGYSRIQSHSSVENDYLKDGYWAMSPQEELKNPNLTASIVKYMEDVTNIALNGVSADMDIHSRDEKITENLKSLLEERKLETTYDLEVKPFYYGNQYILIAKETFKDVRLVGAPPSSIGKFGADTDNWMWPRHTGDFSLFRIYAGPDNKPADIADENIPYKPNYSLKVNIGGFDKNDFTMIYGFPGTTQEYLPSNEIKNIIEVYDPARIAIRDKLLKILDKKMRESDATRIQYASKYASISNAWKKWIGEVKGLKVTNAVEKKQALEEEFMNAFNNLDVTTKQGYGNVLPELKKLYDERKPVMLQRYHYIEIGYYGLEMNRYLLRFKALADAYHKEEEQNLKTLAAAIADGMPGFRKDYDAGLDKQAMQTLLPLYLAAMSGPDLPELIKELKEKDSDDLQEYIEELYEKNPLLDEPENLDKLLRDNPEKAAKKIVKSDAYQLSQAMYKHFIEVLNPKVDEVNKRIDYLQAQYISLLQSAFPDNRFYPDANSTLRVAYGKVEGYEPGDAVYYETQTYLEGVMAKYIPGDYEFDLPAKLIELYDAENYGQYGEDGKMPVCFIASNHTTGGNSGSPALNSKGELIGLNFDRVWEGTMSDINYDISRCRNIMVDARYILFIIDKFAGAGYLVDEMELVYAPVVNKDVNGKQGNAVE